MSPDEARSPTGIRHALAAYGFWGLVPLYWHQITYVGPAELVAHRVLWGLAAFVVLIALDGRAAEARAALRTPSVRWTMLASGLLLSINWAGFVFAVATGRVVQSSLGYFMNPLVSVLLGITVLGERLRRAQVVALLLAAAGVAQLSFTGAGHGFPWLSFLLAGSFGLYGLVRKMARVDALAGGAVETLLVAPIAAAYLGYLAATKQAAFPRAGLGQQALVALAGPITAVPLVWFATAARRLPLTTMGFLQYVGPGLQLLIAVVVFRERFTVTHLRGFALIWIGLAVYSIELALRSRRSR